MNSDKNSLPDLPDGWVWTTVGNIIEKVSITGKKIKKSKYQEKGKLPVIDQGQSFIGGYTDKEKLKVCCHSPLIIFGDHTKAVKYVDFDFVAGADGIKVIEPQRAFYPKLFYYFVQAIQLPDKGYARHFQYLEKSPIPLPPLAEQHRIVAKIEEVLTKLDAGIDSLKNAQLQLKRYRQAVLKSAMEGKLTEDWRSAHEDELEPASVLLELNRSESLDFPDGWVWTKLENCVDILDRQRIPINAKERAERIAGKSKSKLYPYYGATGRTGWIDDYLFDEELVLLGEDGAPFLDPMKNKAYIIRGKSWVNNHVHVLRAISDVTLNRFLCSYLDIFSYRNYVTGTTRLKLNQSRMKKIPIPLPPLMEQHKIVEEIERRLSVADEVEKTIESELKRSERLRQSILKQAFSEKLVPQDPDDEPASVLLEKHVLSEAEGIKAEKARQKSKKKSRRKSKAKKNAKQMRLL